MSESVETASPQEGSEASEANEETAESQAQETEGTEGSIAAPAEDVLDDSAMDKIVKVKIDGQEHKMTVREALKLQSLEKASRARMEQAARQQKQMQDEVKQLVQWAKAHPEEFLRKTGIDPDEFAEARLAKKYELMQMTPEQKELYELRQWKETQEAERQAKEQEHQTKAQQEQEMKLMQDIQSEYIEAWKESGLPAHQYFGSQVAYEMLSAAKKKQDLSAKQAADIVKQRFFEQINGIIPNLTPEQIRQVLGDVGLKKLKDDEIKRATDKQAVQMGLKVGQDGPAKAASPKKQVKKQLNENEWRDYISSLADQLS